MTAAAGWPANPRRGGLEIAVKATPKARRAGIEGLVLDAGGTAWLAVNVTAPAEAGKANAAVLAVVAEALAVAASSCSLVSGAGSRWKRVMVAGPTAVLTARLQSVVASS